MKAIMKIEKVPVLGMELTRWTYKSCVADFGVGDEWATLYKIESKIRGKGHATQLLTKAKEYYEGENKIFGGTVSLNQSMKNIYKKLGIKEYL